MPITLIKKGKACVDELSAEEMREYRGTLTELGKESPGDTENRQMVFKSHIQAKTN